MKLLYFIVLIAFAPTLQQQQIAEGETADLTVVQFSWTIDKPRSSMIRGAQNPGGSVSTPPMDGRDLGSRKAGLRTMDKKPAASGEPISDGYMLRLEVKNTGPKIVTSLVWEFKPTAGPEDYTPKQYICALQVKPKEKRKLEVWTPYSPVKVVSVDARSDALKDGKVIINSIEYADGSVWKKPEWKYKLPADASRKLSEGQCSAF